MLNANNIIHYFCVFHKISKLPYMKFPLTNFVNICIHIYIILIYNILLIKNYFVIQINTFLLYTIHMKQSVYLYVNSLHMIYLDVLSYLEISTSFRLE